ncbi:MAG: isocitrate lyase/PEP mutase family protein [Thermoanaerobaculia bacterium]
MADTRNTDARLLRSYHDGRGLILANAWDAGSAAVIAEAGALAIGTTSAGVSWALGRPDGQRLTRDDMMQAVRRIVEAVDVPVTADIEGGYGPSPEDVGATVEATLAAGAVGINLEDSRDVGGPLFSPDEQADRIRAARGAARSSGVPDMVINARTDVFLFAIGEPDGRLDEVRRRAQRYAEAGADCLFVPGLLDLAALESLVTTLPLPVNAMAGPGGPSVPELHAAGVQRISVGPMIAQVAYAAAQRAARELFSAGTYGACEEAIDFAELNGLFVASGDARQRDSG